MECDAVLKEVLETEGACICETVVDPTQNFEPKAASKVLPDGSIVSPSLDDMKPFLDRKVYAEMKYKG